MFGKITTVAITDPHHTSRLIWESLTGEEKALEDESRICAREFAAFDWRRFQSEPEDFRSRISYASAGELRATRVVNTRATQFVTRPPGMENYCVSLMERGTGRLMLPGSREPVIGNEETGLFISGEPGTRFVASDDSVQFNLWVPARRIHDRLEVLLDGQNAKPLAFQPAFNQRRGPGATIHNMLDFLFAELHRADSLLANEIATRTFEDNLVLCLLLGLPHNHTARLQEQKGGAAPGHVRRAEEFMRANADTPLTIAEIAQAAGCSVRALQLAFQQFRGTRPMAALRRIRLEKARTELMLAGRAESIARIAAGHGFSTPSRFAQLYRRTYGVYPSEALRTQRGARAGFAQS
jgi:AraC-like DNA-binding protein